MNNKKEIRQYIKSEKLLLTDVEKEESSKSVFSKLMELSEWSSSKNVLMYYSLPDELPTQSFVDAFSNNKQIYLPRVNGDTLDVLPYRKEDLHVGAFHIEEPTNDDIIDISIIDTIIVPGVAFDIKGNRVGRGKGYYDKLLCNTSATKIGIAYDFQLLETVPAEIYDIKMDIIITPNRIIHIK